MAMYSAAVSAPVKDRAIIVVAGAQRKEVLCGSRHLCMTKYQRRYNCFLS